MKDTSPFFAPFIQIQNPRALFILIDTFARLVELEAQPLISYERLDHSLKELMYSLHQQLEIRLQDGLHNLELYKEYVILVAKELRLTWGSEAYLSTYSDHSNWEFWRIGLYFRSSTTLGILQVRLLDEEGKVYQGLNMSFPMDKIQDFSMFLAGKQ